jgi:hypothetical protein
VDFRKQLYAPCRLDEDRVDLGAFLQHLLLFERYIIESARLLEVPALVRAFGVDQVVAALNSGAIKLHHSAIALGYRGADRHLHYHLVHVSQAPKSANAERKSKGMFAKLPQLTLHQRTKLANAIQRASVPTPVRLGQDALRGWKKDLFENPELVRRAVAYKAREVLGSEAPAFAMQVHLLDEESGLVRVETNLPLPDAAKHQVVWSGMGAIGNTNFRIEKMRGFEAVCGFRDEERALADDKLTFLFDAVHDGTPAKQLARVLEISGLPDLGEAAERGQIDLIKLLEVRDSRECREFREWLRSLERIEDRELRDRIGSLKTRLGGMLSGVGGRIARFLAGAVDPTAGIASGAGGFFLDQVFARPGPIVFLNDQLPSVFTESSRIGE